mgnify:CR=1 FL=1
MEGTLQSAPRLTVAYLHPEDMTVCGEYAVTVRSHGEDHSPPTSGNTLEHYFPKWERIIEHADNVGHTCTRFIFHFVSVSAVK